MAGFRDEQFPDNIAEGAMFGPDWTGGVQVVVTGSGDEQRNLRWSAPKYKGNVATGVKDADDVEDFLAFLYTVAVGTTYSFPFKDWSDYAAGTQPIGTGDGVATQFQLKKTYVSPGAGFSYQRTIKLPRLDTTLRIYKNGVLQTLTTHYTVSARGAAGGVITFVTPPALGVAVTADFQFDVPCRFASDHTAANIFSAALLGRFDSIELVGVRL